MRTEPIRRTRETLHRLVDELSEGELREALFLLEQMRVSSVERRARDERDGEIIDAHAEQYEREMGDVLTYQADW